MENLIKKQKIDNRQEKIVGFCEDAQTKDRYLKMLVGGLPAYIPIGSQNSIDYSTMIRLFRDIRFYHHGGSVEPVTEFPDIKDFQVTDEYPTEVNIEEKRVSQSDKFSSELDFLSLYTSDRTSNKLSNKTVTIKPSCIKITGSLYQKNLTWNIDFNSAHNKSLDRQQLERSELYVLHKSDVSEKAGYVATDSTNEWLLLTASPTECVKTRGLPHRSLYLLGLLYIISTIISYIIFGFEYPILLY